MATTFAPRKKEAVQIHNTQNGNNSDAKKTLSYGYKPTLHVPVTSKPEGEGPDYVSLFIAASELTDAQRSNQMKYWEAQFTREEFKIKPDSVKAFTEYCAASTKVIAGRKVDFLTYVIEQLPDYAKEIEDGVIKEINFEDLDALACMFAEAGSVDGVRWSIELGADLEYIWPVEKANTLLCAIGCGKKNVVVFLIEEFGLNPNKRGDCYTLSMAGLSGNLDIVNYLLQQGAWISGTDAKGNNVLHYLIRREHFDAAMTFIHHLKLNTEQDKRWRFDFEQINDSNRTVLGEAVNHLYVKQGFFDDNTDTIEELATNIKPIIALCKLIRQKTKEMSLLPYGRSTHYLGRSSYSTLYGYETFSESQLLTAIKQLMIIDQDFVNDIVMAKDNDPTDTAFQVFKNTCVVAENDLVLSKMKIARVIT